MLWPTYTVEVRQNVILYRWRQNPCVKSQQRWAVVFGVMEEYYVDAACGYSYTRSMHTRKLSCRKDDSAMRRMYGCPENFRESLTTPTATFPEIF